MPVQTRENITAFIRSESARLGFDACGIAPVSAMIREGERLKEWVAAGMNAGMSFMDRNLEKRVDPTLLLPEARSVVVMLMNYFPETIQKADTFQVAKYAYGTDYHVVLKEKTEALLASLYNIYGVVHGKVFVDSSPVFEKAWAQKAGLGWTGKNTLLISERTGSFHFIAGMLLDTELIYDEPVTAGKCGNCRLCIDSCPTGALTEQGVLDARKCISYHTIENKDILPDELRGAFGNTVFGCDRCQDACPWNKSVEHTREEKFKPAVSFLNLDAEKWNELSEHTFKNIFRDTPLNRIGYKNMVRNIRFVSNQ